jgi:hypothetical protein
MNLSKNQIFNLIGNAKLANEVLLKLASNERRLRHEGRRVIQGKVPTDEAYAASYSAYMIGEDYSRYSKTYTRELEDRNSQRLKRMLVDAIADFDYPDTIKKIQVTSIEEIQEDESIVVNETSELVDVQEDESIVVNETSELVDVQEDELVDIILSSTFTPTGLEIQLNIVDTIIGQAFNEFMIKPLPPIV